MKHNGKEYPNRRIQSLWLSTNLYERLKTAAEAEDKTVSGYIRDVLNAYMKQQEANGVNR